MKFGYRQRWESQPPCPACGAPSLVVVQFIDEREWPYVEWFTSHCGWHQHHRRTVDQVLFRVPPQTQPSDKDDAGHDPSAAGK